MNDFDQGTVGADLAPIEHALQNLRERWPAVRAAAALATGDEQLDPTEEELARGMTSARRLAYIGGRLAATRALSQLSCTRPVVGADGEGVPIFPVGYLGSIAHKHGRAVAAVTRTDTARGIGIDLEFDENHDEEGLRSEVVTAIELAALAPISASAPTLLSPATLVLAAKEAVYKAAFPITRTPFDFDEAELAFDLTSSSFWPVHFPASEGLAVRGGYVLSGRWIVALAVVEK
jgi:4'-phosphopantetheinyl transferase EntD